MGFERHIFSDALITWSRRWKVWTLRWREKGTKREKGGGRKRKTERETRRQRERERERGRELYIYIYNIYKYYIYIYIYRERGRERERVKQRCREWVRRTDMLAQPWLWFKISLVCIYRASDVLRYSPTLQKSISHAFFGNRSLWKRRSHVPPRAYLQSGKSSCIDDLSSRCSSNSWLWHCLCHLNSNFSRKDTFSFRAFWDVLRLLLLLRLVLPLLIWLQLGDFIMVCNLALDFKLES